MTHIDEHEYNQEVLARLKKIEGQVKGIAKMVENNADCDSVLTQLLAVKGAVKTLGNIVIKDHLEHCVKQGVENGDMSVIEAFTAIIAKFLD